MCSKVAELQITMSINNEDYSCSLELFLHLTAIKH